MIFPDRRSIMFGTRYFTTYMWPLRTVSMTASGHRCACPGWCRARPPGVVHDDVDAAVKEFQGFVDRRLDLGLIT